MTVRPTVPVLVTAGGETWPTYALLDTGANCSAITDELALKIKANMKTLNIRLGTFDNNSVSKREVTSFKVSNLSETFSINVNNALVGNLLSTESEKPPRTANLQQYDHLKDLIFNELEDDSIGLLLDAKYAMTFMTGRVYTGKSDEPIGVETKFGITIIGPKTADNHCPIVNNDVCTLDMNPDFFTEEIRRLFRQDFISRESERYPSEMTHLSANDEYSSQQLNETLKFNEETYHYSCGLPWRHGRSETAKLFKDIDFYSTAKSRHDKLKRKFEKDPVLREGSFKQMEEKLNKGYIRKIDSLEADENSPVCYLPVHVALHPEKPNKFRLCLDAAARVGPHYLNKYLLNGPDFFNRLTSVLLKFRQKRYTLTADIKDYFYQVEVDPTDRPALRCLWWSNESMEETITLEAMSHIFGATSSPCVVNFVLRHHAENMKAKYGEDVYDAMVNRTYVDDVLLSVDSREEAIELKTKLTRALAEGGFELTKWDSNIPELSAKDSSPISLSDSSTQASPNGTTDDGNCSPSADKNRFSAEATEDKFADSGDRQAGMDTVSALSRSQPIPSINAKEQEQEQESDSEQEPEPEQEDPIEMVSSISNKYELDQVKEFLHEIPEKILGVGYDYKTDEMAIRVKDKHFRTVNTKREVLSFISSVYDPLGLVAPFVLKGRQFFQQINESGISWNDQVPDEILIPFNKWKDLIVHLRKLKVPRWTNPLGLNDCKSDLIIFCDSSATGWGHCSYVKRYLQGGSNQSSVSLLMGKAHVVPLSMSKNPTENAIPHGDSIPRLELNAARGAAEWRDILLRESGESFDNVYLFSDSLTVLGWLHNFEKRFKTFENFRIKAIRTLSRLSEWRHCPTQLNPADLCSKGIEANEFKKWDFYYNGPEFLLLPPSQWPPIWPTNSPVSEADIGAITGVIENEDLGSPAQLVSPAELLVIGATAEEPNVVVDHHDDEAWPIKVSKRTGRWHKKIRLIATIRRVILTLRDRVRNKKMNLTDSRLRPREKKQKSEFFMVFTDEEKEKAEFLLVSAIQNTHFEKETISLIKNGVFSPNALKELKVKGSSLTHLSPFIDSHNVIRSGTRNRKSEHLSFNSRFPIILPNHHEENVQSLIRYHHRRNMHTNITHTHYIIKEKYLLLGGKTSVAFVIHRCLRCQRMTKNPPVQRQGDLPPERTDLVAPFSASGIDVFGPFHLRHSSRGTQKRFVLLVTCMSSRAVAMYPLRDMTTSAVVNALMRMNSQFPGVKKIFSDNGSNFKGADREIREALLSWNKDKLNLELDKIGITWEFGPAHCGAAGGAWERIIGLTKHLIKSVIGNRTIDTDDFDTYVAGAAAIMNRRPMMQVPADAHEPLVLSPAHFLYPYVFTNSATSIIPPNSGDPERLKRGWKATQALLDDFFLRFKTEYLQTLGKRQTTSSTDAPKVGDIVLLKDDQLPRESWKLCTVHEITNDDKDHGRRFIVRDASNKYYDRNIRSVIRLEM